MVSQAGEITDLLARWQRGDRAALEHLSPTVRHELIRIARNRLAREDNRNSFIRLRLFREHSCVCYQLWRSNGGAGRTLCPGIADHETRPRGCAVEERANWGEPVALDLAPEQIARDDRRKSRVFEMRIFGGDCGGVEHILEYDDSCLGLRPAWLRCELSGGGTI